MRKNMSVMNRLILPSVDSTPSNCGWQLQDSIIYIIYDPNKLMFRRLTLSLRTLFNRGLYKHTYSININPDYTATEIKSKALIKKNLS